MSKGLNPKPYINPKATIEMRVSEINRLNELVERDEAMAIVAKEWEYEGEKRTSYYCPSCTNFLFGENSTSAYEFCPFCGQRLDVTNIQF